MKESQTLQPLLTVARPPQSVYARQFIFTKGNEKKLTYRFVLGTEQELWDHFIQKGNRTICEVIDARKPCHLYIDIDVDLKKTPGIKVRECWEAVRPVIDGHFQTLYEETPDYIIMDSSSQTKGSLHAVVKLKGRLFTNASHCGAYMRVLKQYIEVVRPELQGAYQFFDLGIYTRNRLFRMLGNTKAGQDRYLTTGDPFTFEAWQAARVCPVEADGELIVTLEPDHTPAKFSSGSTVGSTVIVGWVPSCVKGEIHDHLCEAVGPIQRMVCTGENMKVICNTSNRNCIFLKKRHKSNVLYIVVDLIQRCYHVKCHSAHCKKKRGKRIFFDARLSKIIDDWMSVEVSSRLQVPGESV